MKIPVKIFMKVYFQNRLETTDIDLVILEHSAESRIENCTAQVFEIFIYNSTWPIFPYQQLVMEISVKFYVHMYKEVSPAY